jgi:hypothetical protein
MAIFFMFIEHMPLGKAFVVWMVRYFIRKRKKPEVCDEAIDEICGSDLWTLTAVFTHVVL